MTARFTKRLNLKFSLVAALIATFALQAFAEEKASEGINNDYDKTCAKKIAEAAPGARRSQKNMCARGVAYILNNAQIWNRSQAGQNAAQDMGGEYAEAGFRNLIREYPTPEAAPEGAILVYRGIYAGKYPCSRRPKRGSAGDVCGHTEVKGPNGNGYYYGNGRIPHSRSYYVGEERRVLIGVWLPGDKANCDGDVLAKAPKGTPRNPVSEKSSSNSEGGGSRQTASTTGYKPAKRQKTRVQKRSITRRSGGGRGYDTTNDIIMRSFGVQ